VPLWNIRPNLGVRLLIVGEAAAGGVLVAVTVVFPYAAVDALPDLAGSGELCRAGLTRTCAQARDARPRSAVVREESTETALQATVDQVR
jgi:hypothetical protein